MNPVKVILMLLFSMFTLLGGYALITSVLCNNSSMFFVSGILLCIAGVFCILEGKLCR